MTTGEKIPVKIKKLRSTWTKEQEEVYQKRKEKIQQLSPESKEYEKLKNEQKKDNKVRFCNGNPGHIKKNYPELYQAIHKLGEEFFWR